VAQYKVVFMGPVGAGKTTAVKTATDDHSIVTDVVASDVASLRKVNTTVAMDYGVIDLNKTARLHIHGCPGQQRFDFMWPIITNNAYGLILLIDNSRNYPKRDLRQYIKAIDEQLPDTRLIIGITRTDTSPEPPLEAYHGWLQELGVNAEVIKIDPRKKAHVLLIMARLMTCKIGHARLEPENTNTTIQASTARQENEVFKFDDAMVKAVREIDGINGVALNTSSGDPINSSIEDEASNELLLYLSAITPTLQNMAGLGRAEKVMLRDPHDDSLTAVVGQDSILGLSSEQSLSLSRLGQQLEEVIQWTK